MNITSYNITDVGFHYIALRVLAGLPKTAPRDEQTSEISRSVLKYVSDKAMRLMLPESKGTFGTVGEKICQELVHFQFARSIRGEGYELTEEGKNVLCLLNERKYVELRRIMARVHLQTYDNLRAVVQRHLEIGYILRPIVETGQLQHASIDYVQRLLEPTFDGAAPTVAKAVMENFQNERPKIIETALRDQVLRRILPKTAIGEPVFRALGDRLVSLRLLNLMKAGLNGCEFVKSYSPCMAASPPHNWYTLLNVPLPSGKTYAIYLCEPDMADEDTQRKFLEALNKAFSTLSSQAGFYDLPEVRDFVCERLKIPEATFDEGVNHLLDLQPSPLIVGLRYEGISGRRKPLIHKRETTQIYNLIRRA